MGVRHILFGISDTKECRKAVDSLVKLFSGIREFEITLLHVIPEMLLYAESGIYDYSNVPPQDDIESDSLLQEFEEEFLKHNIKVDKIVKQGNVADILLELASNYDLLVIGESDPSILHRIFNSHQDLFITSSPIPVLIAK